MRGCAGATCALLLCHTGTATIGEGFRQARTAVKWRLIKNHIVHLFVPC